MKHFESPFCSRMDTLQVVQNCFHAQTESLETASSKQKRKQNPHMELELGTDKGSAVSPEEEINQEEIKLSICLQSLGKAI